MPADLNPYQRALLEWSDRTRRDLPWRRTRDPWAVLVSELMLQQTQVARVVPKYHAFLDRFPTPASCAAAPAGDVVRAWAGLGYNRRALNLHGAAKACVERHDGALPTTLAELLALPGIGPYTARAVLAFARNADVGVLDTNAARVTARVAGSRLDARTAQATADAAVPIGRGWVWNQAILDLGATVCTKRVLRCEACPVAPHCAWHVAGHPAPDPADGSAGTSGRQSTYAGSDRQGRGRLVDALRIAPVHTDDLAATMGWPDDPRRAQRVAATLLSDGLAVVDVGGSLALPG
ncbi:MAG TPA: A/G-specific adenine glycosylase [Acidimicrobiales bacterium]|nr:A/G-specific adenine glycosylase [Acidimicrobiales bacterium]